MKNIIFLTILVVSVWGDCNANTNFPHLHKVEVQLEQMNSIITEGPCYHSYRHTYPRAVEEWGKKQTLVHVRSLEWGDTNDRNHIMWTVGAWANNTMLTVVAITEGMVWNKLQIGVIVAHQKPLQQSLMLGTALVQGIGSTTVSKTIPLPQKYKHHLSFLSGIDLQSKNKSLSEFSVHVQEQQQGSKLKLILNIGNNNHLRTASISYIVYNDDESMLRNQGQFVFNNLMGSVFAGLRSDLPTTEWYMFGLGGFKFRAKDTGLLIDFDIKTQYVLEVKVDNVVMEYMQVRFFGMSYQPDEACSECDGKFSNSSGWENKCVSGCEGETWHKTYARGKGCIICPAELNMTLTPGRDTCMCQDGFTVAQGKCVSFMDMMTMNSVSFSLDQSSVLSSCAGANQVESFGSCECRHGYQRNSNNVCENQCGNGYLTQFGCKQCPPGSFGISGVEACEPCTPDCEECASENACRKCNRGFRVDEIGSCIEYCSQGEQYSFVSGVESCRTINYQLKEERQTFQAQKLEISYSFQPGGTFTSEQLSNMCSASAGSICGIYTVQISTYELKVILDFCNLTPVFDFSFSLTCHVRKSENILPVQTQIYSRRPGYSYSIFQERGLT